MKQEMIQNILHHTDQSRVILTSEILFSKQVRTACEQNHCGCWGKTWTCPPGCGSIEQLQSNIIQYKNMLIMTKIIFLRDSFDIEQMNEGRKEFQNYLHQINQKYQMTTRGMMILGVGGCEVCPICTYPSEPCRYPQKKIISLEAAGIDVVSLAKTAKINYYNGKNTITYFAAILYHEDR